jgi:hypothetical protein
MQTQTRGSAIPMSPGARVVPTSVPVSIVTLVAETLTVIFKGALEQGPWEL